MKLVLVRHGQSMWNKENLFTGWTDIDLSKKGIQEAIQAGRILKENDFDFDVCYTSYLKRAIHTLNYILDEMDLNWLPVNKSWELNERHYGSLQGKNKLEMAKKYSEEQVFIWRRSFDTKPPLLSSKDKSCPYLQKQYRKIAKGSLPLGESLKDTYDRVIPFYEEVVLKDIMAKKRVIIVAHGNSIRALIKYLENISDDDISKVNIETGLPLVYELDEKGKFVSKSYLKNE